MTENEAIEIIKGHCKGCEHNAGIECFAREEEGKCWEVKQRAIMSMRKIQEYQAIGTVEECRDAKEKQIPKKIDFELNLGDYTSRFICKCGKRIIVKHDSGVMDNHDAPNYCPNCGQALDWND